MNAPMSRGGGRPGSPQVDPALVNLEDLGSALDQPYGELKAFLVPGTGEVYRYSFDDWEPSDDDPHPEEAGYVYVEPQGSHEAYEDMADFASKVSEPGVRRHLEVALNGRGAFRRFRDALWPHEALRTTWHEFSRARQELRALSWLVDEDLVDPEAAARVRGPIEDRLRDLVISEPRAGTGVVVDLSRKLDRISEHWAPKVVARMNDYEVKLVKVLGEFVWHSHEETDELFLVLSGELTIRLRDREVRLGAGQLYVVPRGVEHCPVAAGEVAAMLVEPVGVVNTGDAGGALTAAYDDGLLDS